MRKNMKAKQKIKTNNKQAISLIVLVITIIVMIILAGSIILTLSSNGIIDKASEAVELTDRKQVETMAQVAWAEAYAEGARTKDDLQDKIDEKLDQEIKYKYIVEATETGVYVTPNSKWITTTVYGVPIPKGFVASSATGENTKNGGIVIYEGKEAVTDENVEDAKRTRNQYVWVPVDDFGKFVRGAYNNTTYSNVLGKNYWEVALDTTTNMPLPTQNENYMTSTTLAEAQAMYESIKEYKGFYIARYEAGLDVGKHKTSKDGVIIKEVHSKMNKAPYNYVRWTYSNVINEDTNGAVEVARSIYPENNENYGVVSTLTYGVQWDRTLAWWVETKAQNGTKDVTIDSNTKLNDSTNYGNYYNNAIPNATFNEGASVSTNSGNSYETIDSTYSKSLSQSHILTTGATEEARVNNIYDMAGNLLEWTMEGSGGSLRVLRGGYFGAGDGCSPVSNRARGQQSYEHSYRGFRPTLYIKK